MDCTVPATHWVKIKESKEIDKYQTETKKKHVEYVDDGDTYCNWSAWNGPQRTGKEIGTVGKWRKNCDYSDYSIVEICQNTKSPGDQRRLVVTQIPVKGHQLTLL